MNKAELENLIAHAAQMYYSGQPIMSDTKFDHYIEWLRAVDPDSEVLQKTGWGYNPEKVSGNKIKHPHGGMQSIDLKPRSMREIPERFRNNVRITPKLDGLSGVIHIKQGKFHRCLTRGDGFVGIDKTSKMAELIRRYGDVNIPKDVDCEIRGEFVISNSSWEKMLEAGTTKKNSRNAASGIINADSILPEFKYIDFVPYKLIYLHSLSYLACPAELELIHEWLPGFPKIDAVYCENGYNENVLLDNYLRWKDVWPCDGVVITQYSMDAEEDCITHYECAYKFDTLKKTTRVINIDWQQSRHNLFKPVANLEPVELGGATIRRVTLHNAAQVKALNIQPGTEVVILRSGDVIPYVEDVVNTDESTLVELPTTCPCCGGVLKWHGVDLQCCNPQCSNVDSAALKVWAHQLGAVRGLSDILLDKYFHRFNITSIDDLYNKLVLDDVKFTLLSEGAQPSKFFTALYKMKVGKINLVDALRALNIPRLGLVTSTKLSSSSEFIQFLNQFKAVKYDYSWFTYNSDRLSTIIIHVAGEATSNSVINNLKAFSNLRYVLDRVDLNVTDDMNADHQHFHGIVCISGNLATAKRADFITMLNAHGWDVKDNVTRATSYLITNTPSVSTSKNTRADELGIPKVTEAEFLQMLKNEEKAEVNTRITEKIHE